MLVDTLLDDSPLAMPGPLAALDRVVEVLTGVVFVLSRGAAVSNLCRNGSCRRVRRPGEVRGEDDC